MYSCLYMYVCVCAQSCFSCVPLFETVWAIAWWSHLLMGFSRSEY